MNLVEKFNMIPVQTITVDTESNPIKNVLGKFSGDFGQIVWCMRYSHIFATEDNNTSAMACILHKVPKKYIQTDNSSLVQWVSLHGMGDGSSVEAIFS